VLTTVLILLALAAALVAALFVPLDYAISARTRAGVRFRIRWLFGLVRITHTGSASGRPARPRRGPAERRQPRRSRSQLRAGRIAGRLVAIEGLPYRAARLVGDCLRSPGLRRARISVRAGTGDPADTGELYGLACALRACLPRAGVLRLQLVPEFRDAVFDAQAEGSGRCDPARLVGALGRFALSRPGLRAIKVMAWDSRR
jgi:hypothetical protein